MKKVRIEVLDSRNRRISDLVADKERDASARRFADKVAVPFDPVLNPGYGTGTNDDALVPADVSSISDKIAYEDGNTQQVTGIPPCEPGGEEDPCLDSDCCVEDTFNRNLPYPNPWGTSDSGHQWTMGGDGQSAVTGGEGLLHNSPSFQWFTGSGIPQSTYRSAEIYDITCAVIPVTLSFKLRYTGIWASEFPWNPYASGAETSIEFVNGPGYSTTGDAGQQDRPAYYRQYFDIRLKGNNIPFYKMRLYNAANGTLYGAFLVPNSVVDLVYPPVNLGPKLLMGEVLNVKVWVLESDMYMKVWKEGSSEPSFWQVSAQGARNPGAYDNMISLVSVAQSKNNASSAFALYIDDICLSSGLGSAGSDCSGKTMTTPLVFSGTAYRTPKTASSIVDVYIDGSYARRNVQYAVEPDLSVTLIGTYNDPIVTATWVMA